MTTFAWRGFDALTVRELHDVLKLRADVFVVEQACLFADIDGRDLRALHLLARREPGGPLAGTLRLFAPEGGSGAAVIGRVAAALEARGIGFGRALMVEAIAEARRRYGPTAIRLSARSRLERFYAGLGFVRVGADYLEDGLPHLPMVRPAGP